MPDTQYISSVTLPSGDVYQIKDAEARAAIEAFGSPLEFLGVTTTTITDGDTTHITYGSLTGTTTPTGHDPNDVIDTGTVVISGQTEYVFVKTSASGGTWYAFGSPAVTFTEHNVIGANATLTGSTNVSLSKQSTDFIESDSFDVSTGGLPGADYDDYITLPKPTFNTVVKDLVFNTTSTKGASDETVESYLSGLTGNNNSGDIAYISDCTLTSNGAISDLDSTPPSDEFVKSYSPSAQWLTVAARKMLKASPSTSSITGVSSNGTLGSAASWSATVTGENLSFSWTANTPTTVPTLASPVSVYPSGQFDSTTTTFATGDMQESTTGAGGGCFLTALGTPTKASALTGLGTPTKTNVLTGKTTKYLTKSTKYLHEQRGDSGSADDAYLYWTKDAGLNTSTSASNGTPTISFNNKDQKTVYGPSSS